MGQSFDCPGVRDITGTNTIENFYIVQYHVSNILHKVSALFCVCMVSRQ